MRLWKAVALVVLVSVVALGCAAQLRNFTRTQYLSESFTAGDLRAGGIALLPITAGRGQEGYRRPLGDHLNRKLSLAAPNAEVVSWEAAMDSLNAHDLVAEYQEVLEAYDRTSIIKRSSVKRLAKALNVRYALYCELQDFSKSTQTTRSGLFGMSTETTANVLTHCLVLDLHSGDVMQEIVGQVRSTAGELEYSSPYETYAAAIARAILSQLPGSQVSPDPGTAREGAQETRTRRWDQ